MADIEIVIKIPEEKYLYAKNLVNGGNETNPVVLAVGNGIALPKGHGDLIDRKELKKEVYTTTEWNGDVHKIVYEASVDDAKAIIKAEDEDEKEQNTEPELEE